MTVKKVPFDQIKIFSTKSRTVSKKTVGRFHKFWGNSHQFHSANKNNQWAHL